MQTAIYKITNNIKGKFYIGLSAYPAARWSTHKRRAKDGYKSKLCSAMCKYGIDQFSFEIIHWCATREDANELEHFLIKECDNIKFGYNIQEGGSTASPSEETRRKIGLAGLGREVTAETRAKISAGLTGYVRPPMTDETKRKLSETFTGAKHSPEAVEKIRKASTGRKYPSRKPQSAEARAKAAAATSVTRTKNAKSVMCVETGEVYQSARLAAKECQVSEALVSMHCNGKMRGGKAKKGLSFRYVV